MDISMVSERLRAPIGYYRLVLRTAAGAWFGAVTAHLWVDLVLVAGPIVLIGLVNGWPQASDEWLYLFAPLIVLGALVLALGVGLFLWSPYRIHDEQQEVLERFRGQAGPIEIVAIGWPVEHAGCLVFPLRISNRDPEIDLTLDIDCWCDPPSGQKTLLPAENDPIAGVEAVLSSAQRADGHIHQPMELAHNSLRAGYLAFRLDGEAVDTWCEITLEVDNAISHVQLLEQEMWPDLWPQILGGGNPRRKFSEVIIKPDPKTSEGQQSPVPEASPKPWP